jgi:hypothetical protein
MRGNGIDITVQQLDVGTSQCEVLTLRLQQLDAGAGLYATRCTANGCAVDVARQHVICGRAALLGLLDGCVHLLLHVLYQEPEKCEIKYYMLKDRGGSTS